MASSVFPGTVTGVTVETATTGALSGDGSSGNKLAVQVDGDTITVNGSNQLVASGGGGGTIGGSIASNQIAVGSGADTVAGSSALTFDDATQTLTLGATTEDAPGAPPLATIIANTLTPNGDGDADGQSVEIVASNAVGIGVAGSVQLYGGGDASGGFGGTLDTGAPDGTGRGGDMSVTAGGGSVAGGDLLLAGGFGGGSAPGTPGYVYLQTSAAQVTDADGGDIILKPGAGNGTGRHGRVQIISAYLELVEIAFASLPNGPIVGALANISNSNTNTWGATIAAGGTNHVLGRWNGSNWTVVGI